MAAKPTPYRRPAIVIPTIEGRRTDTPRLTPERYAQQVAKLAAAGIRIPGSVNLGR